MLELSPRPEVARLFEKREARSRAFANPEGTEDARRALKYLEDPEGYARNILGAEPWSRQQRVVADEIVYALGKREPVRILSKGGHGTGKSHGMQNVALWLWDVAARRRSPSGAPQGCALILTAPKAESIKQTSYYGIHTMAAAAAANGHIVPGWAPRRVEGYRGASGASVSWNEGPWRMIGLTATRTSSKDVAHSVGGIHHPYLQILMIEEALGVAEEMVAAIEGLAVAQNVIILAATNPTAKTGYLYGHIRSQRDLWVQVEFSQLDHPNVLHRAEKIPGSVSHVTLENALRSTLFERRGPESTTAIDPRRLDFVYALPERGVEDMAGPRKDGYPGHPAAELSVFRPTARGAGQHLGTWLEADSEGALFQVERISERMISSPPVEPPGWPAQVGVDCAQGRPPWATPRWGPSARQAITAKAKEGAIACGRAVEIPWTGADPNECGQRAAVALIHKFGSATYVLDRAFGGEVGQALAGLGASVQYVPFGETPGHAPLATVGPVANRRAELHVEAAEVLNSGIAVLPFNERLLEEMSAVGALQFTAGRKQAKILRPKKEIEAGLGRSPDLLDSTVLALTSQMKVSGKGFGGYKC